VKPDREIVVCQRVKPDETYQELACPQCLERCWISPKGAELVAKGTAEPLCLECSVLAGLLEG
jgi:hypothetical protein